MNLSTDQQRAFDQGKPVPLVIQGTECVLLRKDVYERVKGIVDYDDSEWTESEMNAMASIAAQEADNAEPIQ